MGDEYGWKQVHGDVFRSASYPLMFSSLIGTGYQLAVVGFIVIVMSIIGDLYTEYVNISDSSQSSILIFFYSEHCLLKPSCFLFIILNVDLTDVDQY